MSRIPRSILFATISVFMALSCSSQKSEPVLNGPYSARIATVSEDQQIQALNQTSEIIFTFNEDGSLLYQVSAMGRSADDQGQYEIKGDSLYIFGMSRGPSATFLLEKLEGGAYRITGPNQFILTPVKE